MTRRQYRNAPIEEALCEFHFGDGKEWDLATPSKLQEAFRGTYSAPPRFQQAIAANVMQPQQAAPGIALMRGIVKTQFFDESGTKLVAVAPGVLSVHILRPYCGWEAFRPRIANALENFVRVTGSSQLVRIGIRYINKITLAASGGSVDLTTLFRCVPADVPGLPEQLLSFMHRTEHEYDRDTRLVMTLASIPDPGNEILLDLDVIREPEEAEPAAGAMAIVDALRDREREAFEAVITDELRSHFDAP